MKPTTLSLCVRIPAFFLFFAVLSVSAGFQPLIPSVASFTASDEQQPFVLSSATQIIVDSAFHTSGSPSLESFAQTFRDDLVSITGFTSLSSVQVGNLSASPPSRCPTEEGYDFEISSQSYVIKGSGSLEAWWGTRTLLQQVALTAGSPNGISLAAGFGSDTPGWEVRGFMLDAGRHWYQPSFLGMAPFIRIQSILNFSRPISLQTFHLHASDNLWNQDIISGPDWRRLYSAFRFRPSPGSPIAELAPLLNETWSKHEFLALQNTCSAHGVTIVPEIDTPGHSLAISKWKPELSIPGSPDHLNLSHPDTLPTIKAIWDEVLPWITTNEVSIGADEYDPALADDYISFVNEMASYISGRTNNTKTIRVWGTNEPSTRLSIDTSVTIQHWDFPGDSIPVQLMSKGYRVINSEQGFLYLDGKTSDDGQFPWELVGDLMWSGAPGGGGWAPNVFSRTDESNNTEPGNPLLRGAIMAIWNDWGNNATTPLEIYYQLARSLAVFAEKTWAGSGIRSTELSRDQFDSIYGSLNAAAPGQHLNRAVSTQPNNVVFQYVNVTQPITTSFESVGPPYTLTFTVKPSASPKKAQISVPLFDGSSILAPYDSGVIFAGIDSKLHITPSQTLAFEDTTTHLLYPLPYTFPTDVPTRVEIHATQRYTYALIGGKTYWWTTELDIWGEYMKSANMSFAAPAGVVGGFGFEGELRDVELLVGA
ncbi:glycoside hydrolase [Favolaschia claudopus]|uniref:beta-N-acetylhexosaminidase n=1 Tax=Favolaschia claudopus TaxID=2862362 RepID=A0AAW0D7W2_9AGAR